MPIEASYDSDDVEETVTEKKPKANGPPKLDDAEAFPDAEWGPSSSGVPQPAGKSFASLASEVLPPQKDAMDYSQPIKIKVVRKPLPARITKVREQYKRDLTKSLSASYTVYHDEGMPAGVPEKNAQCESAPVGKPVETLKDFNFCWDEVRKMQLDDSSNIRVFKSDISSLSPSDPALEKGGKYLFSVKKELSRDVFEELCIYFFDGRLDHTTVGVCLCIRANLDMIQIWTKSVASAATSEICTDLLHNLLGMEATVTYKKHGDAFKKSTPEARKYYLMEAVPADESGAVMSVNNTFKPRDFSKEKKEKKKGEFSQIPVKERKGKSDKGVDGDTGQDDDIKEDNVYQLLDNAKEPEGDREEEEDEGFQFLEKKKSEKTRKNSSKRGSKKDKKNKNDFDALKSSSGPIIPQQVFIGAGLGGVFFIALLAIFMSGILS